MTHGNKCLTANALRTFTGTEHWYRHSLARHVLYNDGARYVAEQGGAYWLLDAIAFAQKAVDAVEFQLWKLTVHADRSSQILISTSATVFYIEVPEAAKPHMEKLPVSGLVDFVVEMRGEAKPPLIKTWKVKSGESTCMYFNGKECKER